jgi:type II secretion system protein D
MTGIAIVIAVLCTLQVAWAEDGSLLGSRMSRGQSPFRRAAQTEPAKSESPPPATVSTRVGGLTLETLEPESRSLTIPAARPANARAAEARTNPVSRTSSAARGGSLPDWATSGAASFRGPIWVPVASDLPLPASPAYVQLAQAPGAPPMPPMPPVPGTEPPARPLELSDPGSAGLRPAGAAARTTAPADLTQKISIDLRDTDIKHFIKILSDQTQTNWVFDPAMSGKINMLGPQEMTLQEAQYLLKSVLEFKGFTIEEIGSLRRVVPRTEGKFRNTELRLDEYTPPNGYPLSEDRLVTQLIRLKYRNVNEVRGVLVNFAKDAASILPYAPTNSLFITDNGTYIHRLMQIVDELDTPDPTKRVVLVPLRYAFAKSILQPLTDILKQTRGSKSAGGESQGIPTPPPQPGMPVAPAGTATPGNPTILVDEGDNTLMVIAYPDDIEYVQQVVQMLDRDPDHVPDMKMVPLKYSDPETVKGLVSEAFKSDPGLASSIKNFSCISDKRTGSVLITTYSPKMMQRVLDLVEKLDVPVVTAGAAIRVYRLEFAEAKKVAEVLSGLASGDEEIMSSVVSSGSSTSPVAGTVNSLPNQRPPQGSGAVGAGGGTAARKATVIADEATNSLVIVATREKFNQLTSVIKELDVVRPQVLVEVLIVRIDVDRARHLGLDFNMVNKDGSARPFAIGSTGQLSSLFSATGIRGGLNLGLLDSGDFDISAAARGDLGQLSKIGVLINVLSTDTRANILSAPKLLTADNEEAKINVGSQVRIPQGSTLNAINTITNFVTEDLGIILTLTPRITKNDFVAMKIKATIKNLIPGANVAGLPVISNSEVDSHITVENRTTIVMGGLIQEEERKTENKIPLLGNIPVLGHLFRDTSTSRTKSNLLMFMTPHIIRSSATAKAESKRVSPVLRHATIKAQKRKGAETDAAALLDAMNAAK